VAFSAILFTTETKSSFGKKSSFNIIHFCDQFQLIVTAEKTCWLIKLKMAVTLVLVALYITITSEVLAFN